MISPKVMTELHQAKLVPTQFTVPKPGEHAWSPAEQRRFWEAIHRFPQGPWTAIAAYVGSKSTRQAMTHAQKLRQKLSRWKRRVRSDSIGSSGSNSSASATATPDGSYDANTYSASSSPPTSPTEYGDIAKLSIMDHIEEEATSLAEEDIDQQLLDVKSEEYEPMDVKPELKTESGMNPELHDHGGAMADNHEDRYLEHLLSDIEPVLEHVAHFTSGDDTRSSTQRYTLSQSQHQHQCEFYRNTSTVDYVGDPSVYFDHRYSADSPEHKSVELSSWSHHQGHGAYTSHQQQQHFGSPSPVHHAEMPRHFSPAETSEFRDHDQHAELRL